MASEDRLSRFDVALQRFYHDALSKEVDILSKQNVRNIKSALKEVVEAYKRPTGDPKTVSKSIRFDSAAKRCAYVLKHSPCFTSAVARHVLRMVQKCPTLFHTMMLRGEVKLCCLGGGPASDAVAVCKVLSLCRQLWSDGGSWQAIGRLKVKVTVVDVNGDWAVTAGHVLQTLGSSPELGVELSLDFCSADLTRPMEEGVRRVVREADIVTMVYFLSAVNRGRDTIESLHMVKEIMRCMRVGSVLFFLDSAMDVHYRQMKSAADSLANLAQVYGPRIEEFHTLSLESVRTFLDLYKRQFGKFLCLTNCFVSSGAWHKTPMDFLSLDKSVLDNNNTLVCKRLDRSIEILRGSGENYPLSCPNSNKVHQLSKQQLSCPSATKSETLSLMDKCAILVEEDLLRRRQAVRLTARMLQFRAQIGKLLDEEFDEVVVEKEISTDEWPPDDAFDHLLVEYCGSVPEYFFQTKSKKKRIFTGLPVSI